RSRHRRLPQHGNKDAQLNATSEPMSTAQLTGGDEYKRLLFNIRLHFLSSW
ncbi:hypothetical protein ABG768_010435, partial [Culter alburnus]